MMNHRHVPRVSSAYNNFCVVVVLPPTSLQLDFSSMGSFTPAVVHFPCHLLEKERMHCSAQLMAAAVTLLTVPENFTIPIIHLSVLKGLVMTFTGTGEWA